MHKTFFITSKMTRVLSDFVLVQIIFYFENFLNK